VEDGPSGVTFAGGYIWVSNYGTGTISKIEPRFGSVVSSFAVGRGPSAVLFDGRNIWVASSGSNSVLKVSQKKDSPDTN
jgi:DNA-binding beta-propeller fold protein YncE